MKPQFKYLFHFDPVAKLRAHLIPKLKGDPGQRRIFWYETPDMAGVVDDLGQQFFPRAHGRYGVVFYVRDHYPGAGDDWIMFVDVRGYSWTKKIDRARYIPICTARMNELDMGAQEAYDAPRGGQMLIKPRRTKLEELRERLEHARAAAADWEKQVKEEEERERAALRERLAANVGGLMDELLAPLGLDKHPDKVKIYQLARRWSLDHDEDVSDVLKQLKEVVSQAEQGALLGKVLHYEALKKFHDAVLRVLGPSHHLFLPCVVMTGNHKVAECIGCAHHEVVQHQPRF